MSLKRVLSDSEAGLILRIALNKRTQQSDLFKKDLDWKPFIDLICEIGLAPFVLKRLVRDGVTDCLPKTELKRLVLTDKACRIVTGIQQKNLKEVLALFRSKDVETMLLKGVALRRYYSPNYLRVGKDLDVIVKKQEMLAVKFMLHGLGYRQRAMYNRTKFAEVEYDRILDVEATHYEQGMWLIRNKITDRLPFTRRELAQLPASLLFFIEDGAVYQHTVLDIHWNLSFDFDDAVLFKHRRSYRSGANTYHTLTSEMELLYAVMKLYCETFIDKLNCLQKFVDVLLIVRSIDPDHFDYRKFFRLSKTYGLEMECYAVFFNLATYCKEKNAEVFKRHWAAWGAPLKTGEGHREFLPVLFANKNVYSILEQIVG